MVEIWYIHLSTTVRYGVCCSLKKEWLTSSEIDLLFFFENLDRLFDRFAAFSELIDHPINLIGFISLTYACGLINLVGLGACYAIIVNDCDSGSRRPTNPC